MRMKHQCDEGCASGDEVRQRSAETDVDVVVIGGAFSGAASAVLLRRYLRGVRVLVVERAEVFDRKVGEATVEVSAMFLHKVLGLYDFLSREQLPKHGLRYWLTDTADRRLVEMTEVGGREVPRLPAFQLDRAKLDEHLLTLAAAEGAEVLRPAKVASVVLGWPSSEVTIETAPGQLRKVRCRWVIDASGRHAFLARRHGWHERVEELQTAAVWGRWHGVLDLDGPELAGADPRHPGLPPVQSARRLATNHFTGHGWWCWVIPLAGGETSIGVVYDKTIFAWPDADGDLRQRYESFLRQRPGLRELVAGARLDEDDFKSYSHLPYRTKHYMGKGWALVGDAAGFLDPYYSPGLDHCSMSLYATVRLLQDDFAGRLDAAALDARVALHDQRFLRSYQRWLDALYVGKYEILGDAELISTAFLLDTSLYYLGIVTPAYQDVDNLALPTFGVELPQATVAYRLVRFYNRRLQSIARLRLARGAYGRRNAGRVLRNANFGLGAGAVSNLRKGLMQWMRLELDALLLRLRPGRRRPVAPATLSPAAGVPRLEPSVADSAL
jgi:flavin-dependent dehydrogenase